MPRPHGGVEERHAGHQSNKQIGCEAAVGQTGKGLFSVPPSENFGHFLPCIRTRSYHLQNVLKSRPFQSYFHVTLSILVHVSSFFLSIVKKL